MVPYIAGLYLGSAAMMGVSVYASHAHYSNQMRHLDRLEIYAKQDDSQALAAETARYALDPAESLNIVVSAYGYYVAAALATVATILLAIEVAY